MNQDLKSICVMIRKDQHDQLHDLKLNISGFIRDMIDDRLSNQMITLTVTPETKEMYDRIVSMSPDGDANLEPFLREAMKNMLKDHIEKIKSLYDSL
jgi:hypothetical protein